jgi:hypothetical protein
MVVVRYLGLANPHREFAELPPFREAILRMEQSHRPFGPDYLILSAVLKALDTADYHFTREPSFYASKPPSA